LTICFDADGNFHKLKAGFKNDSLNQLDGDLWDETLEFLTKKKLAIKKVPDNIYKKAQSVYDFMINNNVDITTWTKKFPLFRHMATQSNSDEKKNRRKNKHQKGGKIGQKYSKRNVLIDWDAWEKHIR